MTQDAVSAACAGKGLTGWAVAEGVVHVGPQPPPPVFTSPSSTTFTEGDPEAFTVAVSDAVPVARCSGAARRCLQVCGSSATITTRPRPLGNAHGRNARELHASAHCR